MKLITIGLLTYNRASVLPRAIESAINQTYKNLEIIISDDNSSDNTSSVILPYLDDSRVRYIRRPSIGMTQNFIQTLNDARGEYFMWLCDDDFLSNNYVERNYIFLSQNSDFSLSCGKTIFFNEKGFLDRQEYIDLKFNSSIKRIIKYFHEVNSNIILYGLMRREQILELSYPNVFGADILWSCQIAFMGKVFIDNETLFYYSTQGISYDTDTLSKYYKRKELKRNPYNDLLNAVGKLIICRSKVFKKITFFKRIFLTLKVLIVIRKRFLMSKFEARIRGFLKVRTRFESIFKLNRKKN